MAVRLVGELVPDFALLSKNGTRVFISDYRGRRNMVLIFCGTGHSESVRSLAGQLSKMYANFVAEEAELFSIVRGAAHEVEDFECSCAPPFPVLLDGENRAHDLFGAPASEQNFLPFVCIVDRYGEVRHTARVGDPEASSGAQEILDWVRYINLECPE